MGVRVCDLSRSVPFVPGSAADREGHTSLVRWIGIRLDGIHAVLSNGSAAGYGYAHWLARRLRTSQVTIVHLLLLGTSLSLLPIVPSAHWKPAGNDEPVTRILLLLGSTVGLQYVLLASTSPLLQAVWVRRNGGEVPYRWYAISNAGSLLGLLTYPILIEPFLGTRLQIGIWSAAYGLYAGLAAVILLSGARSGSIAANSSEPVPLPTQIAWVVLPAAASILLLTATAYISENIMPVPLMWVLPLSAYLLSFVLCFGRADWVKPAISMRLGLAAVLGMISLIQFTALNFQIAAAIAIVTVGVFFTSTYFHGEVVRLRPPAPQLTRFYLLISLGGAIGGFLASVVAPSQIALPLDFPVAIVLCTALLVVLERKRGGRQWIVAVLAFLVVGYVAVMYARELAVGTIAAARNFYGTLRVREEYAGLDPVVRARVLTHGVIQHGSQLQQAQLRRRPTGYYGFGTGIHLAIEHLRRPNMRVGVVGLGTGTLAAYGQRGDTYRFYEINPRVVELARGMFSYLDDSPATVDVALGDARLVLEREAHRSYDLLALDAFSSDAIPAHLLTTEAMGVYLRHLRPEGIVAFHVSNKILRLVPVVAAVARQFKLAGLVVETGDDPKSYRLNATWVLLSRNPRTFFTTGSGGFFGKGVPPWTRPDVPAWTDDYSNIWTIIE